MNLFNRKERRELKEPTQKQNDLWQNDKSRKFFSGMSLILSRISYVSRLILPLRSIGWRGEGWGEVRSSFFSFTTSSPQPSPPSEGREGAGVFLRISRLILPSLRSLRCYPAVSVIFEKIFAGSAFYHFALNYFAFPIWLRSLRLNPFSTGFTAFFRLACNVSFQRGVSCV